MAITVVAVVLYLLLDAARTGPAAAGPLRDQAYVLEEKLLPVLNLAVWTLFAWVYLAKPAGRVGAEPVRLGALWLALALPVDLVGFVIAPGPLSMSAHDFYVGRFPWIYLTCLAVLASPTCAAVIRSRARSRYGSGDGP